MELMGRNANPYKALIARKILETARELGLQTVAEGVETPEELAWVQAHGADFVQGYLLGRPTSAPRLDTLIHTRPDKPAWSSERALAEIVRRARTGSSAGGRGLRCAAGARAPALCPHSPRRTVIAKV